MDLTPVPLDSDIQVNTTTANDQIYCSVTALADGGFVVTWNSQDGDGWGIYGRRYSATGGAVGAEFLVNKTTANDQLYATVTALADGGCRQICRMAAAGASTVSDTQRGAQRGQLLQCLRGPLGSNSDRPHHLR